MIKHKMAEVPDEVCEQCQQCVEGQCRAFLALQSYEEFGARAGPFGLECDPPHLKRLRWERRGMLYHTPQGKYNKPYNRYMN